MKSVLAVVVALAVPVSAIGQSPPDPGSVGPYAIGHTSFRTIDTRPDPSGLRVDRPIGVSVWYPADHPIDFTPPEGVFKYDLIYPSPPPIYAQWATPTRSSDWERPCQNLPNPAFVPLCESMAQEVSPTYEEVHVSIDAPFPLIVVSPGWTNRTVLFNFFAARLASHGFVVAVAQHYRDRAVAWDVPQDPFHVAMYNRPRDISFMLGVLLARNAEPGDVLYHSMRPDRVAAVGHSIGGYATLSLAAGDEAVCVGQDLVNPLPAECVPIAYPRDNENDQLIPIPLLPDRRIRAIVTLDANNGQLHFSELARVTVPSLTIGESPDAPQWATFFGARQHAAIAAHPNYRVDILSAMHNSFTSSCTGVWIAYRYGVINEAALMTQLQQPWCGLATVLPQREVTRLSAKYAIAFLKAHLVGDRRYQPFLTPGWALGEPNVELFVTEPGSAQSLGEDPATFRYFLYQGMLSPPVEKDTTQTVAAGDVTSPDW